MNFAVKVRSIIDNETALKAVCSVTMDDRFVVHGVKVITTKKGSFITMPFETRKDSEGNEVRKDVFHPITSEARKAMEEAVLAAYEAEKAARSAANTEAPAKA